MPSEFPVIRPPSGYAPTKKDLIRLAEAEALESLAYGGLFSNYQAPEAWRDHQEAGLGDREHYDAPTADDGGTDQWYAAARMAKHDPDSATTLSSEGWPKDMPSQEINLVSSLGILSIVDEALDDLRGGDVEGLDSGETDELIGQLQRLQDRTTQDVRDALKEDASLADWVGTAGRYTGEPSSLTEDVGMPSFAHAPVKDAKVQASPKRPSSPDRAELSAALPEGVSIKQSGYGSRY